MITKEECINPHGRAEYEMRQVIDTVRAKIEKHLLPLDIESEVRKVYEKLALVVARSIGEPQLRCFASRPCLCELLLEIQAKLGDYEHRVGHSEAVRELMRAILDGLTIFHKFGGLNIQCHGCRWFGVLEDTPLPILIDKPRECVDEPPASMEVRTPTRLRSQADVTGRTARKGFRRSGGSAKRKSRHRRCKRGRTTVIKAHKASENRRSA